MRKATGPWLVVIAAVTILSLYMILPNGGLFGRPIEVRPGLDIQGGLRVLLAAEGTNITADQMDQVRQVIDRRVNALGVVEPVVQVAGNNRIIVELPGIQDPDAAINIVKQTALLEFVDFGEKGGCTAAMPQEGQYVLTDRQVQIRGSQGLIPAATAEAGTAEPTAAPTSAGTPVATAQAGTPEATALAGTPEATQQPLFRIVQGTAEPTAEATAQPTAQPTAAATAEATAAATAAATPAAVAAGTKNNPLNNPCTGEPFNTVMTGAGLSDAQARLGGQAQNQYVVSFQLNTSNDEAKRFADHTKANIGQILAIVLDGQVISAPKIQAALTDGGEITGTFTLDTARTLALQLRSGALPVSLTIQSREQVGASLGAESVQASVRAGLLGVLVVFIFLLIYYRIGGLAAGLALLVFAAMNFALYKFLPVTLTLSAITGFLISIGSAIDGNILIFERIKEEMRAGRPLDKAVDVGFSRAWTSIRDSNISSIMIGLILYFFGGQFGASAVRGFAVTLIMGLLLNLFTAVVVTHVFLITIINLGGQRVRQMKLFGQ